MFLMDAITRALTMSSEIAIYAMIVDTIDAEAGGFYRQYGFLPLSRDSQRLFLPLKSIQVPG